jgi:hypothetical protein
MLLLLLLLLLQCPVRMAPGVTCKPLVDGCTANNNKCIGQVFCPNAADC